MAHSGHILHKNYEFISFEGSVSVSAFNCILDLCFEDLDPMVDDGRTLKTTLRVYLQRGPVPSLITNHGQVFRPGS
jgi:hypothetical protein